MAKKSQIMTSGIKKGENILPDDYPVNFEKFYVINDFGGTVIRSDVNGTILNLKNSLQSRGYQAKTIRNCALENRINF